MQFDPRTLPPLTSAEEDLQLRRIKKQTIKVASFAMGTYTLIGKLPIILDYDIPTAATDSVSILYNPYTTLYEWGDLELRFVILHEGEHVSRGHHLRRPEWCHPKLWNIATDYSINGRLMRASNYGKDFIAPKDVLWDKLYSTTNWSCEKIARDILRKGWTPPPPPKGPSRKKKGKGEPCDEGDGGENGEAKSDPSGDGSGESSAKHQFPDSCGEILDAPVRQENVQADINKAREELQDRVAQAESIERSHGHAGGDGRFKVSGEAIDEQRTPTHIVREFLQGTFQTERTFRRPNKRFYAMGHTLPSRVRNASELVVCIDSSGSVGYAEFKSFKSELINWALELEIQRIKVAYVDSRIHMNPEDDQSAWFVYDLSAGVGSDSLDLDIWGGGGTSFDPIFKYIEKSNEHVEALIYMTDGEGNVHVDKPNFPVLWVTTNRSPSFPNQAEWGEVAHL